MAKISDGSIEREMAELASQASATQQQRTRALEARVRDLQKQLWDLGSEFAELRRQQLVLLAIWAELTPGSMAAQTAIAAQQPEVQA